MNKDDFVFASAKLLKELLTVAGVEWDEAYYRYAEYMHVGKPNSLFGEGEVLLDPRASSGRGTGWNGGCPNRDRYAWAFTTWPGADWLYCMREPWPREAIPWPSARPCSVAYGRATTF